MRQGLVGAILVVTAFGAGIGVGRMSVSGPATAMVQPQPQAETVKRPGPASALGVTGMPGMPGMAAAGGAPPGHPPIGGTSAAPTGSPAVAGSVLEVLQVPNYTYLRLQTSSGETWAAVPTKNDLKVGAQVTLANAQQMGQFASKTLNRTFDNIWFGDLAP